MTTPYQAMVRGRVGADDPVVVIGAGGIGIYGIQVAAALGASVVAVDIDPGRVETSRSHGAAAAVCTAGLGDKEARDAIRTAAKGIGWGRDGWKIFEMSGTPAGQSAGVFPGDVTPELWGWSDSRKEKIEIRLSNLMAFDADAFGSWACQSPSTIPRVLELDPRGQASRCKPFITFRPLAAVNEVNRDRPQG